MEGGGVLGEGERKQSVQGKTTKEKDWVFFQDDMKMSEKTVYKNVIFYERNTAKRKQPTCFLLHYYLRSDKYIS